MSDTACQWVVEFSVDMRWIADGFNLTDELAKEMIERQLPYSYVAETSARVISAPDARELARARAGQGES